MTTLRYVALGDSQTEGLLDPDDTGGYRGWADRFAELVCAAGSPHLQYANLAVRGRLIGAIRREQLDAALALRPDLATVMAGLNDLIRPGCDVDAVLGELDTLIGRLRDSGAVVLTNTYPDVAKVAPLLARLGPRFVAVNAGIREVAARHGALVVDFDREGVGTDARIWSPDRIHANPLGHALMASAFADTLGLPGFDGWRDPLPPVAVVSRGRRAVAEARWITTTLGPWIGRRLRGRSSGDGIDAKRPDLLPVAPLHHLLAPGEWPAEGDYRPPSLRDEGFVHLSFADQVAGSANRHYAHAAELLAVQLEPTRLGVPVRVEDSYGSGAAYPHAYGPVPVRAATRVLPLHRDRAGDWVFPPP